MKSFFGGIFIDRDKLKKSGIVYPIKLEYYKTITKTKEDIEQYGIQIIKTEYIGKKIETEEKEVKNMTEDERKVEEILKIFKENEVTPIACSDILDDLFSIYKSV